MAEPTLDELKTRRDALIVKRESLVARVSEGDRTVQYDLNQAKDALAELDKQIAGAAGTPGRRRGKVVSRQGW